MWRKLAGRFAASARASSVLTTSYGGAITSAALSAVGRSAANGRARNCEAIGADHGLTARGRASATPGGRGAAERRRLGRVRSDRTGQLGCRYFGDGRAINHG